MATMTKKKLIAAISQDQGIHPNHVKVVIQNFLGRMTDALANGDRLEFRDSFVVEVVERAPKIGRNPKNAAIPIRIPRRRAVKFTAGKEMRRRIQGEQGKKSLASGVEK